MSLPLGTWTALAPGTKSPMSVLVPNGADTGRGGAGFLGGGTVPGAAACEIGGASCAGGPFDDTSCAGTAGGNGLYGTGGIPIIPDVEDDDTADPGCANPGGGAL